jgi:hypothetical protein
VEINGVGRDSAIGIVFAKDELRCLLVVFVHLAAVGFALFREFLGPCAIAAGIRLLRLRSLVW